jgi:hypothetical protein
MEQHKYVPNILMNTHQQTHLFNSDSSYRFADDTPSTDLAMLSIISAILNNLNNTGGTSLGLGGMPPPPP